MYVYIAACVCVVDFPIGGVCSAGPFKADGKHFMLKTEHGDCDIGT